MLAVSQNNNVATNTTEQILPGKATSTKTTSTIGQSDHMIVHGGLTREYTVYVPKDYDPAVSYPLVVLLHGGNGNSTNLLSKISRAEPSRKRFLADSNFEAKADLDNFIIVAPEGNSGNWNDGRSGTEPAKLGTDDVGFIVATVEEVEETYNIDSKTVYAVGMSNGATMSYRLACARPDVFAAVAGVAASTVKTIASSCTATLPILGIQGTLDPLMTFDGSPSKFAVQMGGSENEPSQVLPAFDNMQLWAENNNCNLTPVTTRLPIVSNDGTSVDKYSFTGCNTARAVEYYVVNDMGHVWPPNQSAVLARLTGPSSANINATDVVWEFLSAHSK
jgi:polyhydroxybutyrate depolymerase